MSRCHYEGVFYRVFCISLLIIAFTFTAILTNVFIDIDGLLSKKEQESQATEHASPSSFLEKRKSRVYDEKTPLKGYVEEVSHYDDEGVYRTKRSLDSTDFLLHIKNPKIKNVLANRLATLLEELDEDESRSEISEISERPKIDFEDIYIKTAKHATKEVRRKPEIVKQENNASERNDNDLHAAMHNILREGIVGHMDLNSVYKRVHALLRSFKYPDHKQKGIGETIKYSAEKFGEITTSSPTISINEERKFFEELTKCKQLQQEVMDPTKERQRDVRKANVKPPKFLIKTLIDIQKNDKDNDNSKENFEGIIKLIYNGKSVKIKSMDEYESTTVTKFTKEETTMNTLNKDTEVIADLLEQRVNKHFSKTNMNSLLTEYLKKCTKSNDAPQSQKEKRLKRNIKANDENETDKHKKKTDKIDDDELFVEIETHFDNKGIKGKKKEELVKQLIEKIQKAIRSNQEENKQLKHLHEIHVKKRVQNPLAHKNESHHIALKDILLPYRSIIYRELYPISKIGTAINELPAVSNNQDWIKKETGPKLISASKSINSAELSQIDVDFKNVMQVIEVPQRLQIPLNIDLSAENLNTYFDLGNLQFLIKDLEGSGFSIGVNQYVDHPPDPESIKLFTGIENLINKYQHKYDQNVIAGNQNEGDSTNHEINKREINMDIFFADKSENENLRYERKVNVNEGNNYHSNEYSFQYQDNFLPYNNNQDILEDKHKKISLAIDNKYQDVIENKLSIHKTSRDFKDILEKKFTPSEIFNLASLLDRKKRSVNVKRFKNVHKKMRLSTFIKTNSAAKQRILLKGKRKKRQIGKIRIIAKDTKGNSESDENIYIVSGENMYADRAVIRRVSIPSTSGNENKAEEQSEQPILFGNTKPSLYNIFEESLRRNPLMLKYPHVFLDDINDNFSIQTPTKFGMVNQPISELEMTTENDMIIEKMPKVQDLVNALTPFPKTNYKVTLKILPRDSNMTNEGFREIHTSINKTFNKNGILYSSLVNVSEISKVESNNESAIQKNNDDDKLFIMLATTPNSLQSKHAEFKSIIKEHRERINKQLENLHNEKEKLNSIMLNTTYETQTDRKTDLMDMLLNLNKSKMLRLSKDDIGKMICNAEKQEDDAKTTTVTTVRPDLTTTEKLAMDPLKVKLLKAIYQNEQLTSQILNKINENSVILQKFLTKITDKLQTLPDITRQAIIEHEKKIELPPNYADPHFYTKLSNTTNLGIPFTYYQQIHSLRSKSETPVATVYNSYTNPNPVDVSNKMIGKDLNEYKSLNDDVVLANNDSTKYFVDEDYFRTYVSPFAKVGEKIPSDAAYKSNGIKSVDQNSISLRMNMTIPKSQENKTRNAKSHIFKSNAPKNFTKSA